MPELNEWRQIWSTQAEAGASRPLSREELMRAIETRGAAVRKRVLGRLRRETGNYVPVVVVLSALSFSYGLWKGLIGTASVVGLIGAIMATLVYKERKLNRTSMGVSLRESLQELLAMLDSTAQAYLGAYIASIVSGLGILVGVAMWKTGVGLLSVAILMVCMAGSWWAYLSGQAYLRRMFGKYRLELIACLRELEEG